MKKLTIEDIKVEGKVVLMRVDFNVPVSNGCVLNDRRLREAVPTILYILQRGGRLVLMSHLGRPDGKKIEELSLKVCVIVLSALISKNITFLNDCIGDDVKSAVDNLVNGEVILLENLRFYKQEIQNDEEFSKKLAEIADVYVNDAFGVSHRMHASVVGITSYIDECVMGLLFMKELSYINKIVADPLRPFVAVIGGAKIYSKINVILSLLSKVDFLIIGGGIVYTFIYANGFGVGNSFVEFDKINYVKEVLNKFKNKIVLPIDYLVTDFFDFKNKIVGDVKFVTNNSIPCGWNGIDIGKSSIELFKNILLNARTVIWNGPMGVFEIDIASNGTIGMVKIVSEATKNGAITFVGGGDSVYAVEKIGLSDSISYISTGGGASLALIGGKKLPALNVLTNRFD